MVQITACCLFTSNVLAEPMLRFFGFFSIRPSGTDFSQNHNHNQQGWVQIRIRICICIQIRKYLYLYLYLKNTKLAYLYLYLNDVFERIWKTFFKYSSNFKRILAELNNISSVACSMLPLTNWIMTLPLKCQISYHCMSLQHKWLKWVTYNDLVQICSTCFMLAVSFVQLDFLNLDLLTYIKLSMNTYFVKDHQASI